jgi:membrane fusion protein (multidrug efflux system)
MSQPTTTPTFPRLRPRLTVCLGLLVVAGLATYALLTERSHAGDGSAAATSSPEDELKPVAIAWVDTPDGVTSLYPTRPGRVVEVKAEEGKEYKKGDLLFRMDDTIERIKVAQAEDDLKIAEKQVAEALQKQKQHEKTVEANRARIKVFRKDVKFAEQELKRALEAKEARLTTSKALIAKAKAGVEKAEAAVDAAELGVKALEAFDPQVGVDQARLLVQAKREQLKAANEALKQCEVTAPFTGVLLRSSVTDGDVLGPQPRQPAMVFARLDSLIVRAEVEQEFARRFRDSVGQRATITDDSGGKEKWFGTVQRVSKWYAKRRYRILDPLEFNDVRTLEVIIRVESDLKKEPLRIGQRVRVDLGPVPVGGKNGGS